MAFILDEETVVKYLRDALEPIPYTKLIADFSETDKDGIPKEKDTENLRKILTGALRTKKIEHCHNHFYAATLAEDIQEFMDLEGEPSPQESDESIYSSESRETHGDTLQSEEDEAEAEAEAEPEAVSSKVDVEENESNISLGVAISEIEVTKTEKKKVSKSRRK